MNDGLLLSRTPGCIPLIPVTENGFNDWLKQQDDALRRWLTATGFKAKAGSFSLIPSADGLLRTVIVVIANADDLWALARGCRSACRKAITLSMPRLNRASWSG
jgi:hypothetical protein